MLRPPDRSGQLLRPAVTPAPIEIRLLGNFQLLTAGQRISVQSGSKLETLLAYVGLRPTQCIPRELLFELLWPSGDIVLASHSLRSLLHTLQHLLGDALGGVPLIVHSDGCYQLNAAVGVATDVTQFDALVCRGDQQQQADDPAAEATYGQAIALYRGDLHGGDVDVQVVMARELLRAHYLALLMRLATYRSDQQDYHACVTFIRHLLSLDPYFEHAHRLLMRCYVRLGTRSIALHHYRVCTDILHSEFDTAPEPDTTALFDQIRLDPGQV